MKNKYIISALLAFFAVAMLQAQTEETAPWDSTEYRPYGLAATVRVQNNTVQLRWAPTSYPLWEVGNEFGYIIERMAYKSNPFKNPNADLEVDEDYRTLPNMPLLPWPLEKWQAEVTDTSDIYAGVAMELLFGDKTPPSDMPSGTSLESMVMDNQRRHAYALMGADFSAKAATGMALRLDDKDVLPGYFYYYRIRFNHTDADLGTDTVEIYVDMTEAYKPLPVGNCATEAFDGEIKITWTSHNDGLFSGYDIERSTDQKTWTQLNKRPYVSSKLLGDEGNIYIDTNTENGKNYFYRLRGYTPFGDKGSYSIIMKNTSRDLTPPAPVFDVKAEEKGGVVFISWDAMPNEADHDGFYVGRSGLASGAFEKISPKLAKDVRGFADFQANPLDNNYYTIFSVDKAGNEAMSYVALGYIVDSVPPSVPTGLQGEIDSNGIVSIRWSAGPEADVIGYRVYWANDTLSEFSQLTGILVPGINYTDSVDVRTLSEYVYYTIVAVDHRYNHSEMSKPLQLQKPDLVPPAAPVVANYQSSQLAVAFTWINSSSDDVLHHRLERKKDENEWAVLATLKNKETDYRDSNLMAGSNYSYRICAVDDAQNETCSEPLVITALDRGTRPGVKDLRAAREGESTNLNWTYTVSGNFAFVVYQKHEGMFTPVARLDGNTRSYQTKANGTFGVRVVFQDGGESEIVEVNF